MVAEILSVVCLGAISRGAKNGNVDCVRKEPWIELTDTFEGVTGLASHFSSTDSWVDLPLFPDRHSGKSTFLIQTNFPIIWEIFSHLTKIQNFQPLSRNFTFSTSVTPPPHFEFTDSIIWIHSLNHHFSIMYFYLFLTFLY